MQAMWHYAQGMAAVGPGPARRCEGTPRGVAAGGDGSGDREDDGLGPLFADRRRANRRALRRPRISHALRTITTRAIARSRKQSRSRTRCCTTSRRPGTGRRARHSARAALAAGKPAEAEAVLPRRTEAQSGEWLVAARACAGIEGAGQEEGSARSRGPLRACLGERRHRSRQDLTNARGAGVQPAPRGSAARSAASAVALVRRPGSSRRPAPSGRSARTPSSDPRCIRRRRPGFLTWARPSAAVNRSISARVPVGADQRRVEVRQIARHDFGRVALGIDAHEHELQVITLDLTAQPGHHRERCRADIRTMGKAREHEAPVASQCFAPQGAAMLIDEFEFGKRPRLRHGRPGPQGDRSRRQYEREDHTARDGGQHPGDRVTGRHRLQIPSERAEVAVHRLALEQRHQHLRVGNLAAGISNRLRSSTTRSASLPTSSEPCSARSR